MSSWINEWIKEIRNKKKEQEAKRRGREETIRENRECEKGKEAGWDGEEKDCDEVKGRKEEMRAETGWYVPNLTVPGIPTKRRVGPVILHSNKLSSDAAAPGPQTTLLMTREKRRRDRRGNQRKRKDGAGRKRERI